jgi:hypothetical protein
MRNPAAPVDGRAWYAGRWRTAEEVVRIRRLRRESQQRRAAHGGRAKQRRYYRERYASDPAFREAELARSRSSYKPRVRQTSLTDEQRAARRRTKEINRVERRRTREAATAARRMEKAKQKRAPAVVRSAWARGKPGSIIRIKYPTMADLDASARRGEFDGFR